MGKIGIGDRLNANSKKNIIFAKDYRKVRLDPRTLIPSEHNKYSQGYKAKHNTNVILRSSPETQQKILCAYVAGGIMKPNEARLELGRETTEDGDDLIVNAGVLKLKDLGKETKGNAEE